MRSSRRLLSNKWLWVLAILVAFGWRLEAQNLPTVSIVTPNVDELFLSTETVEVTSTVQTFVAGLIQVDYFLNGDFVRSATNSTFSITLLDPPLGTNEIFAVVTDGANQSTQSESVEFVVNTPPTISLSVTNPLGGSTYFAQGSVAVTIDVTDDFVLDAAMVELTVGEGDPIIFGGEEGTNQATYIHTERDLVAGTNVIVAIVTDSDGESTTSEAIELFVEPNPVATITSPSTGDGFLPGEDVLVTVDAANVIGEFNIVNVEFFTNGVSAAIDSDVPYEFLLEGVEAGSYFLTAEATDESFATALTPEVRIDVVNAVITTPTAGSSFFVGQDVTIEAEIAPAGVSAVEFYLGTELLERVDGPPFRTLLLTNISLLDTEISVQATNTTGLRTTNAISVSVLDAPPITTGAFSTNLSAGVLLQTVFITNPTDQDIEAARVLIDDLPAGTTVYNVTGTNESGVVYVQYNQSIPAGETVELVIEYFSRDRSVPAVSYRSAFAEWEPPLVIAPERIAGLATILDKGFLGEDFYFFFQAEAGTNTYFVQYTTNVANPDAWNTATPAIQTSRANPVLWIDSGPPGTTPPLEGDFVRIYRVILLAP